MKFQLPRSAQNWISLIGATIALICLFMIVFLMTASTLIDGGPTYLGLVTYILLPAIMILGLTLIPIGMYIQIRRDRKLKKVEGPVWPRIDLNIPEHRNAFIIFAVGTTVLLFISAIGSYGAFEFTESVPFCGQLCHEVMNPEFTAYQSSPHARVACVECHVGPGASWYVKSKLSGLYQVYAALANTYPKPIPTPIENLRPARDVCEQCHWPQKFYSHKLRLETHFLPDEENTQWDIYLIMKIGAERAAHGLREGIHWHINPDVRVEYIASDPEREKLPWVRYTNLKTGESIVYQDQDEPIDSTLIRPENMRVMDCMDCHNRPSHNYRPPSKFINEAMASGKIPVELPSIKEVAVEISAEEYPSSDSAMKAIEKGIWSYYQENYPEIYEKQPQLIEKAVIGVKDAFSKNIFPDMKVSWSAYPNHIGHLEYEGCFRCHNDRHISKEGRVISQDCNLCHIINAQGPPDNLQVAKLEQPLEFKHPVDIEEAWKESLCSDCHTGVNP